MEALPYICIFLALLPGGIALWVQVKYYPEDLKKCVNFLSASFSALLFLYRTASGCSMRRPRPVLIGMIESSSVDDSMGAESALDPLSFFLFLWRIAMTTKAWVHPNIIKLLAGKKPKPLDQQKKPDNESKQEQVSKLIQ